MPIACGSSRHGPLRVSASVTVSYTSGLFRITLNTNAARKASPSGVGVPQLAADSGSGSGGGGSSSMSSSASVSSVSTSVGVHLPLCDAPDASLAITAPVGRPGARGGSAGRDPTRPMVRRKLGAALVTIWCHADSTATWARSTASGTGRWRRPVATAVGEEVPVSAGRGCGEGPAPAPSAGAAAASSAAGLAALASSNANASSSIPASASRRGAAVLSR
mmetsp:Transcript_19844/g.63022  ORF Transcript_19844/g.63022 Transcript_19844/m.63022 type:complete len:220 (-) Transcript_19844:54-713(-)